MKRQFDKVIPSQRDHQTMNCKAAEDTITNILSRFCYPTISQSCLLCFKQIDMESNSRQCLSCKRYCHCECIESNKDSSRWDQQQSMIIGYKCPSCLNFNACVECKNYLDDEDDEIYSCSVCQSKIHQRCHPIPKQIMLMKNNPKQKKACNLKNYMVCSACVFQFGAKQVNDRVTIKSVEYMRVGLKHPSPIHSTWIQANLLIRPEQDDQSQKMFLVSNHQVENIFSIYVPQIYANFTVTQIEDVIQQNSNINKCKPVKNTFKFLTKWKNSYETFVWEQQKVFYHYKLHVIKFLHQLKIISQGGSLSVINIIDTYKQRNHIYKKINLKAHILSTNEEGPLKDKSDEKVDMKLVYQTYCEKRKQMLRARSIISKAKLISCLINNIYFYDYLNAPIVIFTSQTNVSSWINYLSVPFLTIVSLSGPQAYIKKITSKHLLIRKQQEDIFKFDVLIIAYQALKFINTLINLKDIIQQSSLLVMDQNMTPLAWYFYSQIKIGRIKFQRQKKSAPQKIDSALKNQSTGQSQISKKSSLTLSANKSNPNNRQRFSKSLYNNINQVYLFSLQNRYQLNEINRLIVLRQVIQFGINSNSNTEITDRLIAQLQVVQNKQVYAQKVRHYITFFFIYLHNYAQNIAFSSQQQEIVQHFFFLIHPKYIYKQIVNLFKVNKFCSLYQTNHWLRVTHRIPFVSLTNTQIIDKWQIRYDYILCKGIQAYGYGQWKKISELLDWKQDRKMTFAQLLGELDNGKTFGLDCCQFLMLRGKDILNYLSTIQG